MKKGIKVLIYPNSLQKVFIALQLGCCRVIYNSLLDFNSNFYKSNNVGPSNQDTSDFLKNLKAEKPYLSDVHSKVLLQSQRDFNQALQNFFTRLKKGEKNLGYPKFKSKHDNKLSCRFPKDAISSIKGNRINLIKLLKDIFLNVLEKMKSI